MERRGCLHCALLALIVALTVALVLLAHQAARAAEATVVVQPDNAFGERVVALARAEIGRPFRWAGSSSRFGYDCSGLVWDVYRRAGVQLPRTAAAQARVLRPIEPGEQQPGDVVFFAGTYGPGVSHVGIYTDWWAMVDASPGGVREEKLGTPYWRAHYFASATVRPR